MDWELCAKILNALVTLLTLVQCRQRALLTNYCLQPIHSGYEESNKLTNRVSLYFASVKVKFWTFWLPFCCHFLIGEVWGWGDGVDGVVVQCTMNCNDWHKIAVNCKNCWLNRGASGPCAGNGTVSQVYTKEPKSAMIISLGLIENIARIRNSTEFTILNSLHGHGHCSWLRF